MPKLTNTCAKCGKPILKSWYICDDCRSKEYERLREIERSRYLETLKEIPEILWERRRFEIALAAFPHAISVNRYHPAEEAKTRAAKEAVAYADALVAELRKEQKQ